MIQRLIVGVLVWRAFIVPIPLIALGPDNVAIDKLPVLIVVVVLLSAVNASVAFVSAKRGLPSWLRTRHFFLFDTVLGIGLNLWAASLVPPGALLLPNRDVLTMYLASGVLLWTGLLGPKVGFPILCASVPMQLAMMSINGLALGEYSLVIPGARVAWVGAAFIGGLLERALAKEGAKLVAAEGLELGREKERTKLLADMHDTVLDTLEQVVRISENDEEDASRRLSRVLPIVRRQVGEIRRTIERFHESDEPGEFYEALCKLAIDFEARTGIRKEVVRLGESPILEAPVSEAVIAAVKASFLNIEHHAGAEHVNVLVETENNQLRLVVRDDGQGFDVRNVRVGAFGISNSIVGRMEDVGGQARIDSSPGSGTKVELTVPLAETTSRSKL